jgi:uncharacterized coiled-coil protein SlyX
VFTLKRLRYLRRRSTGKGIESRIESLERRLDRVEGLVEGLQDAVHREWVRHDKQAADLERKTEPQHIAQALQEDARKRGL